MKIKQNTMKRDGKYHEKERKPVIIM